MDLIKHKNLEFGALPSVNGDKYPHFQLTDGPAKRLGALAQIQHDLHRAGACIQVMLAKSESDDVILESLWLNAVSLYNRCFAEGSGRGTKLELCHVRDFEPDLVALHGKLRIMRNEYIAHAGKSEYENAGVAVVLNTEEKGRKLFGIMVAGARKPLPEFDERILFMRLLVRMLGRVKELCDETEVAIMRQQSQLPLDDLYTKAGFSPNPERKDSQG